MNDSTRQQIKKRKEYNKKKEKGTDNFEIERIHNVFLKQKKKVQHITKGRDL